MDAIVYDRNPRLAAVLLETLKGSKDVQRADIAFGWDELRTVLSGRPPSVVVLGPGLDESELSQVPSLLSDYPSTAVVQVVDGLNAQSFKTAMRYGIRDVVSAEDCETELSDTVAHAFEILNAAPATPKARTTGAGGQVVCVFGTKGGTGKTTLATNLAVLSAQAGISTVLLDACVRFGDCATFLRIRPTHSLVNLDGVASVDDSVLDSVLCAHETGLKVLCAPTDPLRADEMDAKLVARTAQALRTRFDLVIIDTAPGLDRFTTAALHESDLALLVMSLDLPSVKDAKVCLSAFDKLRLGQEKCRLVLNRANSNVGFPPREVGKALGLPVYSELPSDVAIPKSINASVPVVVNNAKSKASKALVGLARQIHGELSLLRETPAKKASPLKAHRLRPAES